VLTYAIVLLVVVAVLPHVVEVETQQPRGVIGQLLAVIEQAEVMLDLGVASSQGRGG